jgi:hypothetical protein
MLCQPALAHYSCITACAEIGEKNAVPSGLATTFPEHRNSLRCSVEGMQSVFLGRVRRSRDIQVNERFWIMRELRRVAVSVRCGVLGTA